MKLPIIKMKDNCTGKEFIPTGSDPHDYLYAEEKGTGDNKEGYSFVGEDGYMGMDIPMKDMLDILLYHETKIKPAEDGQLNLDFDILTANFKVLDIRVEEKINKRRETLILMILLQYPDHVLNHIYPLQ